MTAVPLLDAHKGGHCRPPGPVTLFFRRMIAAMRRKPAVPADLHAAGAATGYPCCPHCLTGAPCDPRDSHVNPCPACDGVLAGQMLSEVREQWNAWRDGQPLKFTPSAAMDTGEFEVLDAKVDAVLRPVNGRSLGTQPRQSPVPFSELNAKFIDGKPSAALLRQVLDGLRKLPVYGEKPQLDVAEAERLGRVMRP